MDEAPPPPPSAAVEAAPPVARPRPNPLLFFAAVLALFALPGSLAQAVSPLAGLAWSEAAALLLPAFAAAAAANLRPRAALLLARRPTLAQAGLAVAVGVAAFLVAAPLGNLWVGVLPEWLVRRFDLSHLFDRPPLVRLTLAVLAATLAPLCEEAAFRGFLLTALRGRLAPGAAILASGALFAAMHLDPVRLPPVFLLGAVFGWLAWRAGSLWPAVLAHAANNAIVAGIASGMDAAGPGAPRPPTAGVVGTLVAGGGLLAAVASLYARATPSPPPADDALAPRDAGDLEPGYAARRLGPALRAAIAVAAVAFLVLVALPGLRHR